MGRACGSAHETMCSWRRYASLTRTPRGHRSERGGGETGKSSLERVRGSWSEPGRDARARGTYLGAPGTIARRMKRDGEQTFGGKRPRERCASRRTRRTSTGDASKMEKRRMGGSYVRIPAEARSAERGTVSRRATPCRDVSVDVLRGTFCGVQAFCAASGSVGAVACRGGDSSAESVKLATGQNNVKSSRLSEIPTDRVLLSKLATGRVRC